MSQVQSWLLIDFHFYEAINSFIQFEVHAEGVSFDIEIRSYLHRFEVRAVCAVTHAGDCYKLAWDCGEAELAYSEEGYKNILSAIDLLE